MTNDTIYYVRDQDKQIKRFLTVITILLDGSKNSTINNTATEILCRQSVKDGFLTN